MSNVSGVVPTRVGVNRRELRASQSRSRCPHARGGEPPLGQYCETVGMLSPRAWG